MAAYHLRPKRVTRRRKHEHLVTGKMQMQMRMQMQMEMEMHPECGRRCQAGQWAGHGQARSEVRLNRSLAMQLGPWGLGRGLAIVRLNAVQRPSLPTLLEF